MYEYERRGWSTLWRTVRMRRWVAGIEMNGHECREHGVDLEPLVRAQLSNRPTPVVGLSVNPRSVMPPPANQDPFLVIVKCPGNGRPHELECRGYYWQDEAPVPPQGELVPA